MLYSACSLRSSHSTFVLAKFHPHITFKYSLTHNIPVIVVFSLSSVYIRCAGSYLARKSYLIAKICREPNVWKMLIRMQMSSEVLLTSDQHCDKVVSHLCKNCPQQLFPGLIYMVEMDDIGYLLLNRLLGFLDTDTFLWLLPKVL